MRIKIPITGELRTYDPGKPGEISGNPDNPVKPVDLVKLLPGIDFGWTAIKYDYEKGLVEIETTFVKKAVATEWDNSKSPPEPIGWRKETDAEFSQRRAVGEEALRNLSNRTAKQMRDITKESGLVKPIKLV